MKKFLIVFILVMIPMFGYSQTRETRDTGDVKITVNVSKISRTVGNIFGFVREEAKQFKDEAAAGISEETKEDIKEIKEGVKYELKYIHDAIHAGWSQGWRGEKYTPPYKHR